LCEKGRYVQKENETHVIRVPLGIRTARRRNGEALHPERESLEVLARIRRSLGESNFAGQYQQAPAPLGGDRSSEFDESYPTCGRHVFHPGNCSVLVRFSKEYKQVFFAILSE
jgi:hypothetical protein